MGVATGGWGDVSPRFEILGEVLLRNCVFLRQFPEYLHKLSDFQIFQNKVGEIRGEIGF